MIRTLASVTAHENTGMERRSVNFHGLVAAVSSGMPSRELSVWYSALRPEEVIVDGLDFEKRGRRYDWRIVEVMKSVLLGKG